jgi:hypothetical protein
MTAARARAHRRLRVIGRPISFRMIASTRAQVRAAHASRAGEPRADRLAADLEDPFGVVLRPASSHQHCFVAGALALINQLFLDPPHGGMEPEDRLDRHVNRGNEVVMALDMASLVSDQRAQLRRRQPLDDAFGEQQSRAKDANDTRLRHRRGRHQLQIPGVVLRIEAQRCRSPQRGSDRRPLAPPGGDHDEGAREPDGRH